MTLVGSTNDVSYIKTHVNFEVQIGTNKIDITDEARNLELFFDNYFI